LVADGRFQWYTGCGMMRLVVEVMNLKIDIRETLSALKISEEETAVLSGVSHRDLVDSVKLFLFHHGAVSGKRSWTNTTQSLQDSGADAIYIAGHGVRFGFQVKSPGDFERSGSTGTFRQHVLSQIQESRAYKLKHLYLVLAADLTNKSHAAKSRGLLAELHRQNDSYVVVIEPEDTAGLWLWSKGVNSSAMDQMFEAGYAYLATVFDNLGNTNCNSWGKGTGGDWSRQRRGVLRVGDVVHLRAIAHAPQQDQIEFRFSVQPTGGGFDVRRNWSREEKWTWKCRKKILENT